MSFVQALPIEVLILKGGPEVARSVLRWKACSMGPIIAPAPNGDSHIDV